MLGPQALAVRALAGESTSAIIATVVEATHAEWMAFVAHEGTAWALGRFVEVARLAKGGPPALRGHLDRRRRGSTAFDGTAWSVVALLGAVSSAMTAELLHRPARTPFSETLLTDLIGALAIVHGPGLLEQRPADQVAEWLAKTTELSSARPLAADLIRRILQRRLAIFLARGPGVAVLARRLEEPIETGLPAPFNRVERSADAWTRECGWLLAAASRTCAGELASWFADVDDEGEALLASADKALAATLQAQDDYLACRPL